MSNIKKEIVTGRLEGCVTEDTKILVADDDRAIVQLIRDSLEDEGLETVAAYNGEEVMQRLQNTSFALLILDIMMPQVDGLEICRRIRQNTAAPILLLSAKDRELDKVVGLEVGADDYVTKPFSVNELVARVKAHLRREKRNSTQPERAFTLLTFGDVVVNKDTYEVFQNQQKINLSAREFQILVYLIENRNVVLSRERIYDALWGVNEYGDLNTVTVHIKNIRQKLDPDNCYIKTVWGAGYKFTGGLP